VLKTLRTDSEGDAGSRSIAESVEHGQPPDQGDQEPSGGGGGVVRLRLETVRRLRGIHLLPDSRHCESARRHRHLRRPLRGEGQQPCLPDKAWSSLRRVRDRCVGRPTTSATCWCCQPRKPPCAGRRASRHEALSASSSRRDGQPQRPLAEVPLGAIWEPTRSPSPFETTRDHDSPTR